MSTNSILSILSHVVHGYVGNRATVFPLQYLGWDVDAINTTNLSNHPGYGKFAGSAALAELIQEIFGGLKQISSLSKSYDMILTGYTPNRALLEVVYHQLMEVFSTVSGKPVPAWVVDPVLGDNGKLYVLQEVVPMFKTILASGFVTLTTPNQFEFELLSDTKIHDRESLLAALRKFHQLYKVPNVVISSVKLDNSLYSVGFSKTTNSTENHNQSQIFCIPIQEIECSFNGCGDLFTSLLSHSFYKNQCRLTPPVLAQVLHKLSKILHLSLDAERSSTGTENVKLVKDIRVVSLRHVLSDPGIQDDDPQIQCNVTFL